MAFKVKTTAPKKYCVRPNIGIVAPGASIEVQVIMQSQKETPADLQQCKDKFLVQAVATGATDASELDSATFAKAEGKTISETKLRVAYTSPAVPPTVRCAQARRSRVERPERSAHHPPPCRCAFCKPRPPATCPPVHPFVR